MPVAVVTARMEPPEKKMKVLHGVKQDFNEYFGDFQLQGRELLKFPFD